MLLVFPKTVMQTHADDGQGSVVRLAPNLLSISDPRMLPEVYHRYADKSDFYTHGIMGESAPTFQTLHHHEHALRRKIIAPSVRTVIVQISDQKTTLTMRGFSYP